MSIDLSVSVDPKGNPTVIPHEQTVASTDKDVKLVWAMKTKGYEISDITGLPSEEFTGKSKRDSGYEIQDKNDKPDSYQYTVVIHHLETGRKFTVDPTIKNEG
jgi:hypothetical protein